MTAKTSSSRSFSGLCKRAVSAGVLAAVAATTGCATNGPPDPGTRLWHEQRLAEIEAARSRGELTTEQYIALKNEADATRAEYQASLRRQTVIYPSPIFFHHHH